MRKIWKMRFLATSVIGTLMLLMTSGKSNALPIMPACYSSEAAEEAEKKVEAGDIQAAHKLGYFYFYVDKFCGYGGQQHATKGSVKDNQTEAAKLMTIAAQKDDMGAQVFLGLFYEHGIGVQEDHTEAAKWFGKAASRGLTAANDMLGRLYQDGQGVSQNYNEAARLYRMAAEGRYTIASLDLGQLYAKGGPDFPQDYEEAYFWLTLSDQQRWENHALGPFDPAFRSMVDVYLNSPVDKAALLQDIGKHLSPEDKEKIDKRIIEWFPPGLCHSEVSNTLDFRFPQLTQTLLIGTVQLVTEGVAVLRAEKGLKNVKDKDIYVEHVNGSCGRVMKQGELWIVMDTTYHPPEFPTPPPPPNATDGERYMWRVKKKNFELVNQAIGTGLLTAPGIEEGYLLRDTSGHVLSKSMA
ncbi:MAG: tetratricopeptide repeat protein, partial [Rhabdochlamydiaceae bacterium]